MQASLYLYDIWSYALDLMDFFIVFVWILLEKKLKEYIWSSTNWGLNKDNQHKLGMWRNPLVHLCVWIDIDLRKLGYNICLSILGIEELPKGGNSYRK